MTARDTRFADGGSAVLWCIAALYVSLLAAKLLIAAHLDLFHDEATFWQASSRLSAGYMHSLAMTPLLVKIGTLIFGETLFGVRAIHLLMAAALPFAIYFLAHPLVGRRDAILASGISLVTPITAVLGGAYFDTPMTLFTVLGLAAFERARRTDSMLAWMAAGLACALGLATHIRFVPFLLGIFVYLVVTRHGRRLWTRKGLWLCALIAAPGLLPLAIFNLKTGFASFNFHLIERHPWEFQLEGLLFPLEQMVIVTPLLFVALMATLVSSLRRARAGDDGAALMVTVSIVYIGFYGILAPISERGAHYRWPSAGYIPLFVFLPGCLRAFADETAGAFRRTLKWLVPASGILVVSVFLYTLAAVAWPTTLPQDILGSFGRHDYIRWSRLEAPVKRYLERSFDGAKEGVVVAAGNFRLGSELDFILQRPGGVYMLNHRTNRGAGIYKQYIYKQYVIWGLDEDSMRLKHGGVDALIVVTGKHEAQVALRRSLCRVFDGLRYLGDLELLGGQKQFLFYAGRVRRPGHGDEVALGPGNCPTLP